MARPTIAEQIRKAAESGDLEKVKELAGKISAIANTTKKKPKPKVKIEIKEGPTSSDSFISVAKPPGHQRKVIDDEGEEKTVAKIVPFDVKKKRKNTFTDDLSIETADIEYDKLAKKPVNTRPPRPNVEKIKVKCVECKDLKVVWPGEVMHKNWVCDECLRHKHGGR